MRNEKSIRRGEIYYIYKFPTYGSEQESGRPAIVVSNDENNKYSNTIEVVYLTTQEKSNLPTHVIIESTGRTSTALCEQICTVTLEKLSDYVATCTDDEMKAVDKALMASLGIKNTTSTIMREPTIMNDPKPAKTVESAPELSVSAIAVERDLYKQLYNELLSKLIGGANK